MKFASRPFAAAVSALMLAASPAAVLAQTAPAPAPADNAVSALLGAPQASPAPAEPTTAAAALEARGETNGPAPDSAQNPVEVTITQRLNAEIVRRDELADQTDRANQAAVAEYKEAVADNQAERERIAIDAQINAQSRAEYDADQEARYQKAMADWRATTAACERGDTARCRAGSMPARPGD